MNPISPALQTYSYPSNALRFRGEKPLDEPNFDNAAIKKPVSISPSFRGKLAGLALVVLIFLKDTIGTTTSIGAALATLLLLVLPEIKDAMTLLSPKRDHEKNDPQ